MIFLGFQHFDQFRMTSKYFSVNLKRNSKLQKYLNFKSFFSTSEVFLTLGVLVGSEGRFGGPGVCVLGALRTPIPGHP